MMETNCEMKLTNMKTQHTQPHKEIFNDSFFIRKSIISDADNNNNQQQAIQYRNADHNNRSNLYIVNTPGTDNKEAVRATGIDHPKKNSFMKTFLRRYIVVAIALVIANLFLVQQ